MFVTVSYLLTCCFFCSSPTMARCSAAREAGNPETNFNAPGEPDPQVSYG